MYLRAVIIFALIGIFLKFFGLNSVKKFINGGVMIDRKHIYPEELDAPAIAVCPANPINQG